MLAIEALIGRKEIFTFIQDNIINVPVDCK